MIIKRIKLNNIRSYLNEEINFDKGVTLLSGDIGTGKSSILLAIDFGLFGLRKGHLSGSSLLRNGEKNGFVELCLEVEGKEHIIKRTLKRGEAGIAQDYGNLTKDGREKELSSVEIKQYVLELLNYPKEYLTKSKNFIYNYTIYTPQEEMKQILLGDADSRLDTIRKVFGVDKYKRVNENSKIISDYLRLKKRESAVILEKYHDKTKEKEENDKKIIENDKTRKELEIKLNKIKNDILNHKKETDNAEKNIRELNSLKKDFEVKEVELRHKELQIKKNEEESMIIEDELNKLREEVKEELVFNKSDKIEKEKLHKRLHEDFNNLRIKAGEIRIMKKNSSEIIDSIKNLDKCPTCKQGVSLEYKNNIFSKENDNIKSLDNNLLDTENKIKELEKDILKIKKEIDELAKKESYSLVLSLKRKNLDEKTGRTEFMKKQKTVLVDEIKKLKETIMILGKSIAYFGDIDKKYNILKENLENSLKEEKNTEVMLGVINNEISNLNKNIDNLSKEIIYMDDIRKKLNYYNLLYDFLSENFSGILNSIERNVMAKIKNDFDSFFQKWFSMLIDDEILKVRLDEEFSPLIEQAGHEIEYLNLSGGEKTAAALAYRLALNQIINTFVSEIKTKDLLILDEPTDGFSSEQLDRLRMVLDELKTEQIIIVSHESKIESFVDRIIRLEKNEHVTKVF